MNDLFTAKVKAAAVAGWWTVLIAWGFAVVIWGVSQIFLAIRPAWFLSLCGPDTTWAEMRQIFLWVIVAYKFFLWMMLLGVVWLTLWGCQLKKRMEAK